MFKQVAAVALMCATVTSVASAQTKKRAATKSVMHDITVKADEVYTGTMEMAVEGGKVTGKMHLTSPTEITGKVAGTAKGGVLSLEFPYYMTERQCDGTVKMNITMPAKPGLATGTMEAGACGDPSNKVTGTVELKPADLKKPSR
jgi:hypothetical protein